MHLSNFRPVKRVTDVVEIFALVREKIPAKLVMIGDGPDRGAAEYIVRKKRLAKDVFFLGKQDHVQEKLGLADLFLLPSDSESFGLAALEAMACEVPVIATDVGGLPEVVTHGVDGYLFEPRDVATAREIRARNSHAPRSRPHDGRNGARQRPPQILLERHYSALRELLRKSPERFGGDIPRMSAGIRMSPPQLFIPNSQHVSSRAARTTPEIYSIAPQKQKARLPAGFQGEKVPSQCADGRRTLSSTAV